MTPDNQKPVDGGSAFPESYKGADRPHEGIGGGMTLWDYFAAHAATAFSSEDLNLWAGGEPSPPKVVARIAAEFADAMIAERKKRFG